MDLVDPPEDVSGLRSAHRTYYVLVCRECDPESESPIPFESPEARGAWAAEHRRGTGHDRWVVLDQAAT